MRIHTGGGKDSIVIDPTTIEGNLTVVTGQGANRVTLQGVDVGGATAVTLGLSNNYLGIGDSTFTGGLVGHGGPTTKTPGDTYQDLGGDPFNSHGFDLVGFETIIPHSSGGGGGGAIAA